MKRVARVTAGRENWKKKAMARGRHLRQIKRCLKVMQLKLEAERGRAAALEQDNERLRMTQLPLTLAERPPAPPEIRVVVVLIFAFGLIPCNAITRCLGLLRQVGWLALESIPHPSSVVNWVARAGLGLLSSVGKLEIPWLAIVDSSIAYGKSKMLVVLRVPLNHFALAKGAVGLADTECVGLAIRASWSGESIRDFLDDVFKCAGRPVAIVKDQGADLKRGVALLGAKYSGIQVIRDIGHVCALLLKHEYQDNPVFKRFLKTIDSVRARLCHSSAAALRPPKIRAKGRFQGISRLVTWASEMAAALSGAGRPAEGSLRQRVAQAMPGLCAMRFFFARFSRDCHAINAVMELVKNRGLNQQTHKEAKAILSTLPQRSRIKKKLIAWLDETLRAQCRMGIGQTPLMVSSDAIETLYGLVKTVLERTPTPEFGTLSLATPLLCGQVTEQAVHRALSRCSHQMLTDWKQANLGDTQRRTKERLLEDLRKTAGPNPAPTAAAFN